MNLQKIADIAGVSAQTVSRALRGVPGVAPGTRERILRVARDMGYAPHGMASALASGRPGLVGIVPWRQEGQALTLGQASLPMVNAFIKAVTSVELEVVLVGQQGDGGIPRTLARRLVGGVAFLHKAEGPLLGWLKAQSIPCVFMNVGAADNIDTVYPDDGGGVREAVEYLSGLGHRRLAYVGPSKPLSESHVPSVQERVISFMRTVSELGLKASPGTEVHCDFGERIDALLRRDPPTGILCYDEWVAIEVLQALAAHGVRVPQDMSVIGVNDLIANLGSPPLTSVRVPFEETGARAAKLLLARMADPARPVESVKLPERLVIRASTGPAPQ